MRSTFEDFRVERSGDRKSSKAKGLSAQMTMRFAIYKTFFYFLFFIFLFIYFFIYKVASLGVGGGLNQYFSIKNFFIYFF